ncbi:MAG: lactoylglutathione lyase [Salinisphaera sp.]|nr:lactoylglutathione lyase [Salinisphaera sp.]
MLRIKDPERSLAFYQDVLGMTLLRRVDFEQASFSLYFLAKLEAGESVPQDEAARTRWAVSQRGVLELTHNWGSESDPDLAYHDGNSEPQGFGHIAFSVPELDAAVHWFDANGVVFQKRPEDGAMKHIAFIKDPDGYWIEILQADRMA